MISHRFVLAVTFLAASRLSAQSILDPGDEMHGTWRVGTTVASYRSSVYVDRNHIAQRLPSPLKMDERSLHLSKLLGDRWRAGLEIPLSSTSFGAQKMRGISGGNVFIETFGRGARADALLRATWFPRSTAATNFVVPDSSQVELLAAASTRGGVLPGSARAIANWSGRYATADGPTPRFVASTISFAVSPAGSGRLRLYGLAGFSMRTSGRFGGIHFANRSSRGAFGGIRMEVDPKWAAPAVVLEATRDFAVSNGPSGWRLAIAVHRAFFGSDNR